LPMPKGLTNPIPVMTTSDADAMEFWPRVPPLLAVNTIDLAQPPILVSPR